MYEVLRFTIISVASIVAAMVLLLGVPLYIAIWLFAASEEICGVESHTSEPAPDGKKAVFVELKECEIGLGITFALADIVIRPTTPGTPEERILRLGIPDNPDALQAHWAGNHLLVINRPKEMARSQIRTWFPSVKVIIR